MAGITLPGASSLAPQRYFLYLTGSGKQSETSIP